LPALTPKLIELGHWIAGYYLAPVGEVFRAMLPPVTELRTERQIVLTDAGPAAARQETTPRSLSPQQTALLSQLAEKGVMPFASAAKLGLDDAALQRLRRAGLIEIRESMLGRKAKTQRVVAWKGVAGVAQRDRANAARRIAGKLGRAHRSGGGSVRCGICAAGSRIECGAGERTEIGARPI
jgi:primosomal protein N' (replication factor Y)